MIEGHGDDAWKYNTPLRADFSSNVLYGPIDDGLLTHLRSAVADVSHYPEAGALSLQKAAAMSYGVGDYGVVVTNGVTEAIYLIAQAFRRRTAVIYTPAFAEYEDACTAQGMNIQFRDWNELRFGALRGDGLEAGVLAAGGLEAGERGGSETGAVSADGSETGALAGAFPEDAVVFLCNPNNPTGWTVSLERLYEYPDTIFVIDESYIDFASAAVSVMGRGYANVLVLRSLTKSCRIPGLRVGFVIGADALISRLRAIKMPWSVNRLALEAGLYIFSHARDFVVAVERLRAETEAWREKLRAATGSSSGPGLPAADARVLAMGRGRGWNICETDTHYFLVETPEEWPAHALKQRLIERHGLLVRDASNFRGLGPNIIRVACQSAQHNELLTQALAQCAGGAG